MSSVESFPSNSRPFISVVVPCFNEEAVLPELFERLVKSCQSWDCAWEVICVDDGSSDKTWDLIKAYHAHQANWKGVSFSRNFGHQTAVSAGLRHAKGDAVIVMDADLQDPPENLHQFIQKWQEGFDVVYAVRTKRKESWVKRAAYAVFYRGLAKISSLEIPVDSGDFGLMSRRVVDVLNSMPERNRFVRGLRAWAGFKQTGLVYERSARAAGDTHYTVAKLFKLAMDGLLSFSAFPLKLASHIGAYICGLSLLGIVFTLLQRIFHETFSRWGLEPVPGFATTVIAILFLGGVQLVFLGIIGEYLYRIFEEVKARPLWIERERVGD